MSDEADISALRAKVAKGAGIIGLARFAVRILGFVNTIIVARLLAPDDFGIVAIAVTTMQLLQNFSDVGVNQAVIRFRDANDKDVDTLFTLSALRGIIVAAILLIAAPFVGEFYNDERVKWVFVGVAIYPLALGLMNPRFFEFERDLDFSKDFWISTINKLAGVAVSIAIAFIYRSYWAIILGLVTGGVVQLIMSYAMRPYRPRFSLASFEKVFKFSGWVAGVSFVAALNNKLDALIIARLGGAVDAGKYYLGIQLADLPSSEIASPVARAIYPGFSSLSDRKSEMRDAYLHGVEAMAAIALPAAFGFALLAQDIILLLIGEQWLGVVPVVQYIAPIAGLQALFLATQFYAMANDQTKYVFYRETIFFFIRTPVFIWATIEYGLTGAIWACAATGLLHTILNAELYKRVSGGRFIDPFWAARRSILSVGAMSAYLLFISPLAPWNNGVIELPLLIKVIINTSIGGGVFLLAHYLLWHLEGEPDSVENAVAKMVRSRIPG